MFLQGSLTGVVNLLKGASSRISFAGKAADLAGDGDNHAPSDRGGSSFDPRSGDFSGSRYPTRTRRRGSRVVLIYEPWTVLILKITTSPRRAGTATVSSRRYWSTGRYGEQGLPSGICVMWGRGQACASHPGNGSRRFRRWYRRDGQAHPHIYRSRDCRRAGPGASGRDGLIPAV